MTALRRARYALALAYLWALDRVGWPCADPSRTELRLLRLRRKIGGGRCR